MMVVIVIVIMMIKMMNYCGLVDQQISENNSIFQHGSVVGIPYHLKPLIHRTELCIDYLSPGCHCSLTFAIRIIGTE